MKLAADARSLVDRISSYVRRPALPLDVVERIRARSLGVEHLGRWLEVPAPKVAVAEGGPRVANEPSLVAQGGRLVGFSEAPDSRRAPSERQLILLSGAPRSIYVRADDLVLVAPREWN